ncbi:MAG TPA: response regulator transcription factor [Chthoniobacterales bacterium]|nr:response regulator transcription factor [Chthoniobacterales bacterium]
MPRETRAQVVLVEDHPMFREQLTHLINKQPDMAVCAEANNAPDGLAAINRLRPSLAIIDITLKDSSGLELLKDLRAQGIKIPVLVLSMHAESLYAERALRAGANGYITKEEASAKVMTAIRQVINGEIYLDPRFMKRVVSRILVNPSSNGAAAPLERLTDRELAVFELIGEGRTTREISLRLRVSVATIETYRARIKEKLGLENAGQLHAKASSWVHERHAIAG